MPHLTIEYSTNLRNFGGFSKLCNELAQVLVHQQADGQAVYPVGGIRVRSIVADHWCIGDGSLLDAAFVHARLQIGAGRSEAVRKATGDALFEALKKHFAREYEAQGLALSLEITEFSEAGTWKHNNLHGRYQARAAG
jgi:5-carboxymethyl-2-hydroxymuconate isomerase